MRLSHHHPAPGGHHLFHTKRSRGQRGYVLVMFALLLVPLLLMAGFAVDIGSWYSRASDIRRAADAAALAGVVWLPDETKARSVALEAAARNGFVPSSNISITVTTSTKSTRRIKVTITDNRVGSFFYKALGGRDITLTRTSYAEYVLPVPLGSPRNFFGTGTLLANYPVSGITPEYLYQAVNPYCTDKENGDRYQSANDGGTCSGTVNSEYRTRGYQMYIEAPAGRTSPIEVRLYDARYNDETYSYNDPSGTTTCSITYAANWTTPTTAGTLTGPAQYQTRNSATAPNWTETATLASGATRGYSANRIRYKLGTTTCVPKVLTEDAIDSKRQSGDESYTYTLYAADSTPLNDADNPQICTKTFTKDTPFDGYSYLGSQRWNTLCSISTSGPSGRYILRVTNGGVVTNPEADGSNQYGLVAKYTTSADPGLCDGRITANCPRVYGVDAISVRAASTTSVASFFLAEIEPEHEGKQLKLELFDPGEGGQKIEIMMPSGTNGNTWTPITFSWVATGATPSSGSGTYLDVTNSKFNGKLVEINVDLTGYNPPTNNYWWQIRYTFSGTVTDRTTWSARVTGDPVHLVEEY